MKKLTLLSTVSLLLISSVTINANEHDESEQQTMEAEREYKMYGCSPVPECVGDQQSHIVTSMLDLLVNTQKEVEQTND